MRDRWPFRRRETLVIIGLVIAVIAAIPDWVGLLEKHGYDGAWLIPALQWVQRTRWVIVAVVAFAVTALLVWKFWRQSLRLLKWLGGLPKRFYLWLLWELVIRPARDHRGLGVPKDPKSRVLGHMSHSALRLLSLVAAKYVAGSGSIEDGSVRVEPWDWIPSSELASLSEQEAILVQRRACEELVEEGFFARPRGFLEDHRSARAKLRPWCTLGGGARAVLRGVTWELEYREGLGGEVDWSQF